MTIIDVLTQNAWRWPDEVALVEINPQFQPESRITWRDYALMQPEPGQPFRRQITWKTFEEKANQFANLLLTRGCKRGDKVAILLMNSIEWLPIYFGVLKTGAIVVPLNYRYTADEILYCLEKADCS
ncbi:MAG: acyl--CoA ligase, partial [Clostridia bacterium]|nr:acyl--CoA ligase [Clostridia bacterium]